MRAAIALAAAAVLTACTFPSVVYDEGCVVPSPPCNTSKYVKDGNDADDTLDACLMDCNGTPECNACRSAYDDAIAKARNECELCGRSNGCTKPEQNCLDLVDPDPP